MTPVALRPATAADSEFCYRLHKAAMGNYITAIWGWDEQVQRSFHTRSFNPARWQIITAAETDIGMLDVEYRPGEIYLARIEICPITKGAASAPASLAHSSTKPGAQAMTWSWTCLPSTTARKPYTSGSA
jgi:hypothetical protein